tara:strand:- start:625 stop:852 length:228 start_codon:yes stop_codon:yes gene_type:complete
MPKDKKVEATSVASPRSRLEKDKAVPKLKPGQAHQDEFLKLIQKMFKGVNVDIMECDKVPKVVLDFKKKDKTKLN